MTKDWSLGKTTPERPQNPGGQTHAIASYLMCDNVMGYMQCAIFGTIRNMLPCHANKEFSEEVLKALDGSMSKFVEELRNESSAMFSHFVSQGKSGRANYLYVTGVGFMGQVDGRLYFGRVFTGPEEKRCHLKYKKPFGDFTSTAIAGPLDLRRLEAEKGRRVPTGFHVHGYQILAQEGLGQRQRIQRQLYANFTDDTVQ